MKSGKERTSQRQAIRSDQLDLLGLMTCLNKTDLNTKNKK
jgi:hypothetical protein